MNDSPDVELWATAISKNASTGRQIFWRYAKDLRPSFDRSAQPHRIIIVLKYASASGQPGPTDHNGMNSFEDALAGALKGSHVATLALVSTGENLREWTYHLFEALGRKQPSTPLVQKKPGIPLLHLIARQDRLRTWLLCWSV